MKRKDAVSEMKSLSAADLRLKARSISEELMKLRFRQATGQLQQSHRIGHLKKDLARVNTFMKLQVTADVSNKH